MLRRPKHSRIEVVAPEEEEEEETCHDIKKKKTRDGKRKEKTKIIAIYTSTSPENIHFPNSCKRINSLKHIRGSY